MNSYRLLYSILFFIIALSSCGKDKKQIVILEAQLDSLTTISNQQQMVLDDMTSFIVDICAVMDSINSQEAILTLEVDENGKYLGRKRILENLNKFEEILQQKRFEIERLDSMLQARNDQVRQLSALVRNLYDEIDQKNSTIDELRRTVQSKDITIKNLNRQVGDLSQNVADKENTIIDMENRMKSDSLEIDKLVQQSIDKSRVYVAIGTYIEFIEAGIIDVFGVLKKMNIDINALDSYSETDTEIAFKGTHPVILNKSDFPLSSYSLIDGKKTGQSKLIIHNAPLFWSKTRVLVIRVN